MHGLEDITIPINLNSAYGPSPFDGIMSKHGSYFEEKETYLNKWADAMKCSNEETFYETPYDGQNYFYCLERKCPENGLKCPKIAASPSPLRLFLTPSLSHSKF